MKILFINLILGISLFALVITGNQDKVSVQGGTIEVTSGGVTEVVESGQITFLQEDSAPTRAVQLQKSDLKDIQDDFQEETIGLQLSPTLGHLVTLKFETVKYEIAKGIKKVLLKQGFSSASIHIDKKNHYAKLTLIQVPLKKLQKFYPIYYKAAKRFFRIKRNKNKVAKLMVREREMRQFYEEVFNKYD